MSFLYQILKLQFVLLVTICLFGCSDKSQITAKQSVAQANGTNKSQIAQSQITQSKTKQKEVKPGAAIKLVSPSIITINSNEQASIEIVLEANESDGELQVEISSYDGLNLLTTVTQQTINLASANIIKFPVTLLAAENGRYYLKMHARIINGDETSTRNLAVIIQVGPESEKAVQLKKISGENVISLPAQETISAQ